MSDTLKNNIPTTKLPASILLSAGLGTVPRYATDTPIVVKIAKMKLQEKYESRNARLNGFCTVIISTGIVQVLHAH
jgi:hypothetical protein